MTVVNSTTRTWRSFWTVLSQFFNSSSQLTAVQPTTRIAILEHPDSLRSIRIGMTHYRMRRRPRDHRLRTQMQRCETVAILWCVWVACWLRGTVPWRSVAPESRCVTRSPLDAWEPTQHILESTSEPVIARQKALEIQLRSGSTIMRD